MTPRSVRRPLGGACVGALALLALQTSAAADAPDKTAWFSTVPGGIFPPAPLVPSADLSIGAGAAGSPTSFTAVDYTVGGPESVLTLTVDGANSKGTPQVVACPTTSSWSAGPDQSPSAAPTYDCSSGRSVPGKLSTDGKTITFHLNPALGSQNGGFSLAVVPDPAATSPFQLDVTAPKQDSLVTPSSGSPAVSGSQDAAIAAPGPDMSSVPDGSSAALPTDSGAGLLGVGATPAPLLAPGTPPAASPAPASRPPTTGGPAAAPRVRPVAHKALIAGRRLQMLGVLLLVDAVGTVIFLATKPERAPRLLGSLASRRAAQPAVATLGGVGRFARPRTGPPRRL